MHLPYFRATVRPTQKPTEKQTFCEGSTKIALPLRRGGRGRSIDTSGRWAASAARFEGRMDQRYEAAETAAYSPANSFVVEARAPDRRRYNHSLSSRCLRLPPLLQPCDCARSVPWGARCNLLKASLVVLVKAGFVVVDEHLGGDVHRVDEDESISNAGLSKPST